MLRRPSYMPVDAGGALGLATVATVALAASTFEAMLRPVPAWEQDLTSWINAAPDAVAVVLWPVMQAGSAVAPVVVALVLLAWKRDVILSVTTLVAGLAAWFGAKAVKLVVDRDRPGRYIAGIDVREGLGDGLGYLSGHSTVAATLAVCVTAQLPGRWRLVPAAVAGAVGVSRIVYGMHFVGDVVGGWSLGTVIGLGATWSADRVAGWRRSGAGYRWRGGAA